MDITLALGGGGAKGNSHIGVLRCLLREGFRIRAVAGTSFGGIVAAAFAAGFSPDEIEDRFSRVDQTNLYGRVAGDRPSLLGLAGVYKWLDDMFGAMTFADLKIPCAMVAVDLDTGREVILREGRVRDAILATIALPGIFPSYPLNGWNLIDGGVLNPVPVSVARSLAPDLPVVAVVLTPPIGSATSPLTIPLPPVLPKPLLERVAQFRLAQAAEVFLRSVEIGSRAVTEYRLAVDRPDVVIRPKVGHIQVLQRVDVRAVARLGEEAAEAALPELRRAVSLPARIRRLLGGRK
ncbi:MAG: patatin-like phospholipase family protein [Anaerolineae bacterium]